MKLNRIGMLAVDSSRTRAYLDLLQQNGLSLSNAILLQRNTTNASSALPVTCYFDNQTPAADKLNETGTPTCELSTCDVNDPETISAVEQCDVDVLIYSGPGGTIVGKELIHSGKQLLHIHPGIVPEYRGSTTVYYSLLNDNQCGASAIFLNEKIDCGPVLATCAYPAPADRTTIDHGYDPYIRADLLIRVLKDYIRHGQFLEQPQNSPDAGETYFIMHPVLRHIAALSQRAAA